MTDINFTTGVAPRLRIKRDGVHGGLDVDFFDRITGKYLAGRYLNQSEVQELVTFLSPPVNDTTTERVVITGRHQLQVGDVVVATDLATMAPVVARQVPKPVEPSHGFGTAYVFGTGDPQKRYRGFKSGSGAFYYLNDEGFQRASRQGQYEDFRLEGGAS
jgi:hypothetical protein